MLLNNRAAADWSLNFRLLLRLLEHFILAVAPVITLIVADGEDVALAIAVHLFMELEAFAAQLVNNFERVVDLVAFVVHVAG